MGESAVLLSALGIVASCVAGLIWLVKEQNKQNNSTLKDNTNATNNLNSTLASINHTLAENRKADKQYQKANADFRELVIKYLVEIDKKSDRNFEAVNNIKEQTVEHQTVVNQEGPKV